MTNEKTIGQQVSEAFPFKVERFPLCGPDNLPTPFKGLFRSDNSESVGKAVSARYEPHTTNDIVCLAEAASTIFEATDYKIRTTFKDGHYLSLDPGEEFRQRIHGTSDDIWPRLVIAARYDGRAFVASIGAYRDACKNLVMMKMISNLRVKIAHTSGLRDKMDDLVDTFSSIKGGWTRLVEVINRLEAREVQLSEFLNQVYSLPSEDSSKRSITMHDDRTTAIFNRVTRERMKTGRPDFTNGQYVVSAWEAYQAVHGYELHDAIRRGQGSRDDFSRALVASETRAVRVAEQLAISA